MIVRVVLGDNPNWTPENVAKAKRGDIKALCHDGTPCADFTCPRCGAVMHLHLSQLEAAPAGAMIVAPCKAGGCPVEFELERDPAIEALTVVA